MSSSSLTRRRFLSTSATISAGIAVNRSAAAFQLPRPEPLNDPRIQFIASTESRPWQTAPVYKPTFQWTILDLNLAAPTPTGPPIQGFGACFNELGWVALSALPDDRREAILHELFHPTEGARFTYCRMPIGPNDYATEAYSYDETDNDFELKNFSIDHDRKTLVPMILAAKRHQPALNLWASPWTPPSWMKRNHFYAEAAAFPGWKDNGIRPDQIGHEGEDFFIQKPEYFAAYARYFGKFIDAYRQAGIDIGMVMPQNEFNSAQNFPSCTWTPEGLAAFLHHLGPEMEKRGVKIFFGTLERGNPKLFEKVMADPEAARYIAGIGTQWAGKNALPALHNEFPSLIVFQSEQECGDGANSWSYTTYCWQLMKHYLRSGASGYMYWNLATPEGGVSTWGWPQNSLLSVDLAKKTFHYNSDFYLLKHLTHFVELGARRVDVAGTMDNALAFLNPDRSLVLLLANESNSASLVAINAPGYNFTVELAPNSFATVKLAAV